MTTILSLDLGTKFGWALSVDGHITHGTIKLQEKTKERKGVRYLNFYNECEKFFDTEVEVIYYEQVRRHMGTNAAHMYGAWLGILEMLAYSYDVPLIGVEVKTIKKHITGNGNAKKEDIIEAVQELGFDPMDDNDADALALLNLAMEKECLNN